MSAPALVQPRSHRLPKTQVEAQLPVAWVNLTGETIVVAPRDLQEVVVAGGQEEPVVVGSESEAMIIRTKILYLGGERNFGMKEAFVIEISIMALKQNSEAL